MTGDIDLSNRHGTGDFFKNRQAEFKNSERGHCHFLKLTGDIGDPPSRAPGVHFNKEHLKGRKK